MKNAAKKKGKNNQLSNINPVQKSKEFPKIKETLLLKEDIPLGLLIFSLILLFSTQNLVPFTLPKLVALRLGTLLLVLWSGWSVWKRRIVPVPSRIVYSWAALGLWWILVTFFALHKPTALNGFWGRYNGLWTYWNYLILFIMISIIPRDEKQLERIGQLFIAALIPVGLYSFIQYLQLDPIPWSTRWSRSVSTIGHGVPLGALLGMALPFILAFYFQAATRIKKVCLLILLLFFIGAMLFTLSRGPWIAALIGVMIVICLRFKTTAHPHKQSSHFQKGNSGVFLKYLPLTKPKLLPFLIIISFLVMLGTWFVFSRGGNIIGDRFKTFIALETDTSFAGRILYYKAAIKGIEDHPLLGIGFENFRNIYPRYRMAEDNQIFEDTIPTMVHNGYMQLALETGIPGLVFYLAFLAFVLWGLIRTYKENKRLTHLALIGSLAVFLIQDLSGWPDIALTPFLWIFLGLAVSLSPGRLPDGGPLEKIIRGYFIKTIIVLSIIFLTILTLSTLKIFQGDRLFGSSQYINMQYNWPEIETRIVKGLEWIPNDSYYEDLAALYYLRQYIRDRSPGTYKKGVRLLEKAHQDNPFDPYVLIHRIELEQIALGYGAISKPSDFVQKATADLLQLDRNNRSIYKSIARLKIREEKFSEALTLIESGNVLNQGASNPREEWVAAQHGIFLTLVKKKDYPSALKVIQQVIAQYPDDVPTHVLMGNLYGELKNWVKAKEAFSAALKLESENKEALEGLRRVEKNGRSR